MSLGHTRNRAADVREATAAALGLSLRQCQRIAAGNAPVPDPVALLLRCYLKHGLPD